MVDRGDASDAPVGDDDYYVLAIEDVPDERTPGTSNRGSGRRRS
jgi:hypothetical protein